MRRSCLRLALSQHCSLVSKRLSGFSNFLLRLKERWLQFHVSSTTVNHDTARALCSCLSWTFSLARLFRFLRATLERSTPPFKRTFISSSRWHLLAPRSNRNRAGLPPGTAVAIKFLDVAFVTNFPGPIPSYWCILTRNMLLSDSKHKQSNK